VVVVDAPTVVDVVEGEDEAVDDEDDVVELAVVVVVVACPRPKDP
jgi:hypothetical protein